jgi:hypothetical protein
VGEECGPSGSKMDSKMHDLNDTAFFQRSAVLKMLKK